ncbi:MAG: hypothetical protein AMXMBFR12_10700 [Candidatus Babeliales bacterium]
MYQKSLNMELTIIAKEDLSDYHFVQHDVLSNEIDRARRKILLDGAMALGNDYKQKVRIVFETTEGTCAVETTVWAVTNDHVELKAGKDIPIHVIQEVVL